ncbi:MAG: LytR C-terminal domain-containing protein, partial [Patescibacteria group bacterium]
TEFRPISAQPPMPVKKDRTKLIILIIAILLVVGGFFLFNKSNSTKEEESVVEEKVVVPTKKVTPTPEEDITPTEAVDEESSEPTPSPIPTTGAVKSAKELNIQVLNGSGTAGAAGEVEAFLKELGYEVVITGNADNFDYEGVTINIKSSRSSFLDDIKSDLSDKYTVNDETGNLSSSSEFDVTIIIGS